MAERNIPVTCCRCRVDGNKSVNQVSFTRHEEAALRWRRGTRRRQQENGSPAAKAQGMCPTHFSFSFISFSFSSSSSAHLIHFQPNSCALVTESAICKWHANDLVSKKNRESRNETNSQMRSVGSGLWPNIFFRGSVSLERENQVKPVLADGWTKRKGVIAGDGYQRTTSTQHLLMAFLVHFFPFFFKKRILPKTD